MSLAGWNFEDKPKWNWDCNKCKFITQLQLHREHMDIRYCDVYLSCNSHEESEYILVYSNEPGDYSSSVTLKNLFAYYFLWREKLSL